MIRVLKIVLLFFLMFYANLSVAQTETIDSISNADSVFQLPDSAVITSHTGLPLKVTTEKFRPDPITAVWKGAIIPGYGQILNRKYWKLPIVYGGLLGCAYAITWNSGRYNSYKTAYRDILLYTTNPEYKAIIDKDPSKASFIQILPDGYTIETIGGIEIYTSSLKTAQDSFRRYRDLSIMSTIAFYALTLVDAFVDAQLYDFDISPELSLRVQPTLLHSMNGTSTLGMQCSFNLNRYVKKN